MLLQYVFILVLLAGSSLGVVPHQSLPDCEDQHWTICVEQRLKLLDLSKKLLQDNTDIKRRFDGLLKVMTKQNEAIEYLKQENSRLLQENQNLMKVNHKMQDDQKVLNDLYHLTRYQLNYTMERYAEKVMEKTSLETYYMNELSKCTEARKQEGDTAVMEQHQQTTNETNTSVQRYVTETPQTCPCTTAAQTMPELEMRRKYDVLATTNVPEIVVTPEIIMETAATDSQQTITAMGHLLVNSPQTSKTSTEKDLSTCTAPSSQEMPTLILETMTGKVTMRNKEVPLLETSLMVVPQTTRVSRRIEARPTKMLSMHNAITKMVPIQSDMAKRVPAQTVMTKLVPKTLPMMTNMVHQNKALVSRTVPKTAFPGTPMTGILPRRIPGMITPILPVQTSKRVPKSISVNTVLIPGTPMAGIIIRRIQEMTGATLPVEMIEAVPMESQIGMVPQQLLSAPPPPPPQTESAAGTEGVSDNFIAEICAGDGVFCDEVSEELTEHDDSLEEMQDDNNALSQN